MKESLVRRISPELSALLSPKKQGASPDGSQKVGPTVRGASFDVTEELEKLKAVTISELQPGEMIIASSTIGKGTSRLTAIAVITGVSELLKALQQSAPPSARNDINTPLGLPSSLQSISIGLP
jgi:hypothetical protein